MDEFDSVTVFVSAFPSTTPAAAKKNEMDKDKPLPRTKQEAIVEYKRLETTEERYSYMYITIVTEMAHGQ